MEIATDQRRSDVCDRNAGGALKEALSHFDKIYVLTLPGTPQRQLLMQRLLGGIEFEFVVGTHWSDFNVDELERQGIIDTDLVIKHHPEGQPLQPGEIGCSLSHRMLYERIAASSFRSVVILEDDLELGAHGIGHFSRAMTELPSDWELLYLDYGRLAEPSVKQRLIQVKHGVQSLAGRFPESVRAIRRRFSVDYSAHLLKPGYLFYTSAYAITPSAARTLLQLQSPVSYIADHLLAKACTENLVNAFALKYKLLEQYSIRDGGSLTRQR